MSKILIADDELSVREIFREAFISKGYEVVTVSGAQQALDAVFNGVYDLILLDINLVDGSGIEVLRKIRKLHEKIPIVIYSGALTPTLEKEARAAGANEVLRKDAGLFYFIEQTGKIIRARHRIFAPVSERRDRTLLVVDDEKNMRRVLADFFSDKGYQVSEAASGEEALELAKQKLFSVALLDIHMPGMNGIETLQKLLGIQPKLGVVMVTGDQDDDDIKKALALGAYSYVLKPFDFLYLEVVVMSKLTIAQSD